MKIIIDLLLISMILGFGCTVSGFGEAVKKAIWKWFVFPKPIERIPDRPFFCSKCLTFWFGLVYLIATGNVTIPMVAILCLISHLSTITETLLYFVKDLLAKIFEGLYRIFGL